MSAPIYPRMPATFDAGTTVQINQTFANYPSSTWAAVLYLSANTGTVAPVAITGTAGTNNSFNFVISNTVSASLTPGQTRWTILFTNAGVTEVPGCEGQGVVNVTPNFAVAQTPSTAQTMVTLLQTVLQTFATTTLKSTNFQGQEFTRADIKDYQQQLVYWQAQLIAEQAAIDRSRGGRDPGRVHISFDPCATQAGPFWGWPWIIPYQ